jgi:hypothetical protein
MLPGAVQGGPEVAALVQAEIESVHLVAGSAEERGEDSSDIAAFTGDKHSHFYPQYV